MARTLSPFEKKFTMAVSIEPVPDEVITATSFLVLNTFFKFSLFSFIILLNSGVLWWIISFPKISRYSSGILVGPGVNNNFELINLFLLKFIF